MLINRNERRGNIVGNRLLKLRSLNEEDAVTLELDECVTNYVMHLRSV